MPYLEPENSQEVTYSMTTSTGSRTNDLSIHVWPTSVDAIDWSKDGDIAIAAADEVQLLIPKVKASEDASESIWEMLRMRVTVFSPEELQPQSPISTAASSVGEEISIAEVVSARWTPAGIAKHDRHALIVHTQNMMLSTWAPAERPIFVQDWKRRALINKELQNYFEQRHPDQKQVAADKPKSERLKRAIRVRAFGLSSVSTTNIDKSTRLLLQKYCLIATSNDEQEVAILQCLADGDNGDIRARALSHFTSNDESQVLPNLAWTFEDFMNKAPYIQHLSWSPWFIDEDGSITSLLAFATRSRLSFRKICLNMASNGAEVESTPFNGGSVNLKKPWTPDIMLRWLPDMHEGKLLKLVACTGDSIIVFTVDTSGEAQVQAAKHPRSEWGSYAGATLLRSENDEQQLIYTPHTTPGDTFQSCLHLKTLELTKSRKGIEEAVKHHRENFQSRHNLEPGDVLTKIWGLATSPLQDISVSTISYHPSRSPEYIIPANMVSVVTFDPTGSTDYIMKAIESDASTEALILSLRWALRQHKTQPEKKTAAWKLLDDLDKALQYSPALTNDPSTASFSDMLYASPALLRLRYERLVSLLLGHAEAAEDTSKQIVEKIVVPILQIPSTRYKSTPGSRILLANFKHALVSIGLAPDIDGGLEREECDICSATIEFGELGFARCGSGHKFRRCALTFLAIQAPGISRSCSVCAKQYLKAAHVDNEYSAHEDLEEQHAENEFLTPLTKLLSEACDRCIYCGGKFVG